METGNVIKEYRKLNMTQEELVVSMQGTDEKMLNHSQIDSIFDYVPQPE